MAHEDGKGFARVKVVTDTTKKDYVKVKQVDDPTIKNYLPVKETTSGVKDYKKVVVVDYDAPKDYLRVNFIDGVDNDDSEEIEPQNLIPADAANMIGDATGVFSTFASNFEFSTDNGNSVGVMTGNSSNSRLYVNIDGMGLQIGVSYLFSVQVKSEVYTGSTRDWNFALIDDVWWSLLNEYQLILVAFTPTATSGWIRLNNRTTESGRMLIKDISITKVA